MTIHSPPEEGSLRLPVLQNTANVGVRADERGGQLRKLRDDVLERERSFSIATRALPPPLSSVSS